MSSLSVPYILGGTLSERQRLITQARGRNRRGRVEGSHVGPCRTSLGSDNYAFRQANRSGLRSKTKLKALCLPSFRLSV